MQQCDAIPDGDYAAPPLIGAIAALRLFRFSHGCGFAAAPSGTTFEQMEQAPADDQYQRVPYLEARPGLAFYSHVGGLSSNLGYGKVLIEEITLNKPQGVKILYNWVH